MSRRSSVTDQVLEDVELLGQTPGCLFSLMM